MEKQKLISWNVNGLRAIMRKGFVEIFQDFDADIFALQEIKMQEGQLDLDFAGYRSYWNYAERKGYSGTAIFTKQEPLSYAYGIGLEEHDQEGRVITLEFETYYFVTCYTPNSQTGLKRLPYRLSWESAFQEYISELDSFKPVVLCGDLNVAHTAIDLKNPDANHFNAGFSDEERSCFSQFLERGFTDSFRYFYPEARDRYSWWSYRTAARSRNAGWRIDYFMVSDRLSPYMEDALIYDDVMGSDHCPVGLILDFNK